MAHQVCPLVNGCALPLDVPEVDPVPEVAPVDVAAAPAVVAVAVPVAVAAAVPPGVPLLQNESYQLIMAC